MPFAVKITPSVIDDIFEIAEFIALDNPLRAYSFVEELEKFFQSALSQNPKIGKIYKDNIGMFSYKGYSAFYDLDMDARVVKLRHIVNLRKPLRARRIDFAEE